MKKSSLTSLLVLGFIGACATTETGEDLCNPHDRSCRLNVLIPSTNNMDSGVAGNATGTSGGGNGGGGGTPNNGGGGTANNGGGGTANNAGDGGENNQGGDGGEDNGGTGGGGAGGTGGDGGSGGNGGTGGAPECTVATQAADCDDDEECTDDTCVSGACVNTNTTDACTDDGEACTDDVCSGGTCTHPPNTDPCAADSNFCTNDVCGGGACTHPAITPCTQDTVVMHVNRCNSYVMLDANNYLLWDNQTLGSAETFTRVTVAAGFKLRATSNSMWVRVDNATNDKLVADQATEANATVFSEGACADGWSGISFPTDNDGNMFLKANDANTLYHMEASNLSCSDSASSWEKIELCPGGTCALTGSGTYCPP